jgi:antitoxin (DNA-binding transcriptional repressor) of toxin-antitoxin stability system
MAAIDAHDLHERTAEIVQRLRENGEPFDITDQGRVVARLMPVEPLDRLARPGRRWKRVGRAGGAWPTRSANTCPRASRPSRPCASSAASCEVPPPDHAPTRHADVLRS